MKLTSNIACDMIKRIEALNVEIEAVYREARTYDGQNNDRVIRDAVDARARQFEAEEEADAYIASFDVEDDD